jgi:hypothetical protein
VLRSTTLSIESASDKTDDCTGGAGDEDAEEWTLICVRCEDDRADETDEKTWKADGDCASNPIRERGAASSRFITGHTIQRELDCRLQSNSCPR